MKQEALFQAPEHQPAPPAPAQRAPAAAVQRRHRTLTRVLGADRAAQIAKALGVLGIARRERQP